MEWKKLNSFKQIVTWEFREEIVEKWPKVMEAWDTMQQNIANSNNNNNNNNNNTKNSNNNSNNMNNMNNNNNNNSSLSSNNSIHSNSSNDKRRGSYHRIPSDQNSDRKRKKHYKLTKINAKNEYVCIALYIVLFVIIECCDFGLLLLNTANKSKKANFAKGEIEKKWFDYSQIALA